MTRVFSTDTQALAILERAGYIIDRGIIKAPKDSFDPKKYREPSVTESDAVTYLCDEWDYSYVG